MYIYRERTEITVMIIQKDICVRMCMLARKY